MYSLQISGLAITISISLDATLAEQDSERSSKIQISLNYRIAPPKTHLRKILRGKGESSSFNDIPLKFSRFLESRTSVAVPVDRRIRGMGVLKAMFMELSRLCNFEDTFDEINLEVVELDFIFDGHHLYVLLKKRK